VAWSIFSQGGGSGAALTWAQDLLKRLGAPLTAGNEQMVYDWETSEGGGGQYNPLNQGDVPGDPSLTSTGSQYGGGAADYVSWDAGLTGAADYLAMPAYAGVLAGLVSNDPKAAETALWDSPWAASHYGYGSAWSDAALPGKASVLAGGSSGSGGGGGFDWNPLSWPGQIVDNATQPVDQEVSQVTGTLQELAVLVPVVLAAGALAVVGLVKATGAGPKIRQAAGAAGKTIEIAGAAA
jgi:hypothetical protein